jgi:hypothetical protein
MSSIVEMKRDSRPSWRGNKKASAAKALAYRWI